MRIMIRNLLWLAALAAFCVQLPDAVEAARAATDLASTWDALWLPLASGGVLAMGIANQDVLDAANLTAEGVFDEIFTNPGTRLFELFTEVVPTGSKVNEIDILETMPVIKKWTGAKEFDSIQASYLRATIEKWHRSFEIDRLDLTADKLGMIGRRIRQWVTSAARDYDKIATDALLANPIGYDGVAIASTAHPRGPSGNQGNTGTTALSFPQHDTVMIAGASLRDQNGESLGVSYDTLMVGPKLAKLGREITQSTERVVPISAAGVEAYASAVAATSIPNKAGLEVYTGGSMTLVVNPRLVGTYDDYYVYQDTTLGPKPIRLYEFRAPELIEQLSMDGETRFLLDKFRWSIETDCVAAPGAWQTFYMGIV